MSEERTSFVDLLLTDEGCQEKLMTALEGYEGEQTEEAVFDSVFVPLAKEYGIDASYEEFEEFAANRELSMNELDSVNGGWDWGNFKLGAIFGGFAGGFAGGAVGFGMGGPVGMVIGAVLGGSTFAGSVGSITAIDNKSAKPV